MVWAQIGAFAGAAALSFFGGSKSGSKANDINQAAIDEARSIIELALSDIDAIAADAEAKGLGALDAGGHAARKAFAKAAENIMKSAKLAASELLKDRDIIFEQQEKFFAAVDGALSPYIDQGVFANDEIASMLGIPDHEGNLVGYDTEKLSKTPGYQFVKNETIEGLMRSRLGNKLSTGTAEQLQDRVAGLAEQTFNTRVDHLQQVADRGKEASSSLAGAATSMFGDTVRGITGTSPSQAYLATIPGLAQLGVASGNAEIGIAKEIASLFGNTAAIRAGARGDAASSFADLALAGGASASSPWDNLSESLFGLGGNLLGRTFDAFIDSKDEEEPV